MLAYSAQYVQTVHAKFSRGQKLANCPKTQARILLTEWVPLATGLLSRIVCFSPTVGQWEVSQAAVEGDTVQEPSAFAFHAALLFVDISGFTPLCALADVDTVQSHINQYFTQLINIIAAHGGDVLRFAGQC